MRWILPTLLAVALTTAACDPPYLAHRLTPGLTGGWSTAGCAFTRKPLTSTVGDHTMLITPPELDAAMARIDRGGRTDHADSYAGLEVDQRHVRAVVYRVPSAAFDDFVRYAAADTCVLVRDATHGLTELTAWHDRIVDDLPMWRDRGVRIASVGARHDGIGVEVGTPDVARARVEMPMAYGRKAPLIFVEEGPATPLVAPTVPSVPQPGG